jgi:hypothetical protein
VTAALNNVRRQQPTAYAANARNNSKSSSNFWDIARNIANKVALVIFNAFSFWGSPFVYTMSFFVGVFAYDVVRERITKRFEGISWRWLIPTATLFYALAWPATLTAQAILIGLDAGSRWSYAARF